ncbi:hemolysin III [Tenacibaculum sp. MAR_2009_124]|uniref:PAQR family membrane homeostasis protein TrhA n=1 Tax=Tenacibaculum sp. MAR_2009_124 TaxID=1250059 RepID=UPI00089ABB93|nr:hemolysin III family protein [Tenacibaculum sp. MAR_2009_124]SEB98329.1 hemolysin III [Tenacibaculum sp. MAR_2009_124]
MVVQTRLEEKWNTISHAAGAVMGLFGLVVLFLYNTNKPWSVFSIVVYGVSIIVLFSASALYHATKTEDKKRKFRIVDHISIYLLIAGTYTPVLLLLLPESKGWLLFCLVWGIAAVGTVLKLFFTGKFGVLSTLLYLVMGWLIVLDFEALKLLMNPDGIHLLWAGGAFYTIGIIFYAIEKIPFHHVIWHFFVLGGAICHYFMILNYVIR